MLIPARTAQVSSAGIGRLCLGASCEELGTKGCITRCSFQRGSNHWLPLGMRRSYMGMVQQYDLRQSHNSWSVHSSMMGWSWTHVRPALRPYNTGRLHPISGRLHIPARVHGTKFRWTGKLKRKTFVRVPCRPSVILFSLCFFRSLFQIQMNKN